MLHIMSHLNISFQYVYNCCFTFSLVSASLHVYMFFVFFLSVVRDLVVMERLSVSEMT